MEDIDKIYQILSEVYNNAKLPLADITLFESAYKVLSPKGMIKYFRAFNNNENIGVICILAY